MQRVLLSVVLLGSTLLTACSETAFNPSVPTELVVSVGQMTLLIGDSALVAGQVLDQDGNVMPTDSSTAILWSTDSPAVVRVTRQDQDARLNAVSTGSATVTATFANLSTPIAVDVVGVSAVTVTPSSAQMVLNGGTTLTAEVRGLNGERIQTSVFWRSADPTIAAVASPTGASVGLAGTGLGSTTVIAEALGVADTITAQVVPDTRFLTAVLELVSDTVMTDANTPASRFPVRPR